MLRLGLVLLLFVANARADDVLPRLRKSLVRVSVSTQAYDSSSPWNKGAVGRKSGRGVVVQPGVILTPAVNVRNHIMVEVSVANSVRRYPAKLRHVDYRIGLALVEIADEALKATMEPLPVGDPLKIDDEVDVYQLGGDNMVERSTARVIRANASFTRLTLTVQTSGSDSGNGQTAIKDGKIVGLLTSTQSSKQRGTLLSVETIKHYLEDFKDGKYNGLPGGGMFTQALLRDDLRDHYGVSEDQHGIAITRVGAGRTGSGVVQEGDVLSKLDGYAIDDEGRFKHETHGRLSASYLWGGRRYAGDTVKATVIRGGKPVELELVLKPFPRGEQVVPSPVVDGRPEYLVVGGLVILELTSSVSAGTGSVLRRYRDRSSWDPPADRRRIVFADRVLADPSNKGYERLRQAVIETVNGQKVREISDVAAALETVEGDFHVFTFEGGEADFVVRAAELGKINARIAESYDVEPLQFLNK
jgi:S1-C subfamily serine protease